MFWLIVMVSALWGLHHFVKYALPVLRVTGSKEAWNNFNEKGMTIEQAIEQARSPRDPR